jgi:hypothetical protein
VAGGTELWLLLLAALSLVAAIVIRRMSRLIARTRELEGFQGAARRLDARFTNTVEPLVIRLDELRRRAGDPAVLAEMLPPAAETLRAAAAEARGLKGPRWLRAETDGLVRELERAIRATEMVDHGLQALMTVRGERELEAQTSLKRGALNLRHARGAFHEVVVQITSATPADDAALAPRRTTAGGQALPTYFVDGIDGDVDGTFDPRM